MTKFILIDHSLHSVGGHHFEYALHVLRAAERAGFEIWLAANRKLRESDKLPAHWKIRPVYQLTTYTRHRYSAEIERDEASPSHWLSRLVGEWWSDRRRSRRAIAFARDTATLFDELVLEPGDQVFIPTLSELDLLGLAQYLAHDARTRRVDWHLQFHYPIFTGCEPDYASQDSKTQRLRRVYNQALLLAADHRLYFYTTTDQLTAQQNRLGVVPFQTLPYPANPALQSACSQPAERPAPLRVAYLGDARHEKGYHLLPAIVERLWRDYVETDRVRFVVQSNIQFAQPARGDDLEVVESVAALRRLPPHKLTILDEPAESQEFSRRLLATDIGLLLYDRRPYFSRCSGLLVELLSAAAPVLVSAGCWMADQLADATRDYHTSLRHNRRVLGKSRAQPGKTLPIPAGASDLLLFFLWPNEPGESAGAYVRVEANLFSAEGQPLGRWPTVIGPGLKGRWSTALVRLPPQAAAVTIEWQNAYGPPRRVEFRDAELCFIAPDPRTDRATPRGAVGLVAADPLQAPELLIDLVENYQHYRQTATQFARSWTAWHNPDRVVAELLSQRRAIPLQHKSADNDARDRRLRREATS
jgi:hypothetical protein